MRPEVWKWWVIAFGVGAAILIPFGLWGEALEGWFDRVGAEAGAHPVRTGWLLGGLLATDVFLPVPSTVVGTAAGWWLGFWGGLLAVWGGMMAGSLLGYGVGRGLGETAIGRWMGGAEMARLEDLQRRWGDRFLFLARPIPVLAESSTIFAGMGRMAMGSFLRAMFFSNLAVAAVYVGIGAGFARTDAFLAACGVSVLLTGILWLSGRSSKELDKTK